MDGAYIPDNAIIEDSNVDKPIYSLTEIHTNNIQRIINRNATKRDCLNRISSTSRIHKIPYQVYFMSVIWIMHFTISLIQLMRRKGKFLNLQKV